jgi:hypothetical protein
MNDQFIWWLVVLGIVAGVGLVWVAFGPVPDDEPADDGTGQPADRPSPGRAMVRPYAGAHRPYGDGAERPDESGEPEPYAPLDTRWPVRTGVDEEPADAESTSDTP